MNRCWPASRDTSTPASVRIFKWWEMVGCERSNRSRTWPHESSPAAATSCVMRKRFRFASALSTLTSVASSIVISKYVYILTPGFGGCKSACSGRMRPARPRSRPVQRGIDTRWTRAEVRHDQGATEHRHILQEHRELKLRHHRIGLRPESVQ